MVKVIDLWGGRELMYSLPGPEAVVAAYEQNRGNNNTWTYPAFDDHPEAMETPLAWYCDNFACLKER